MLMNALITMVDVVTIVQTLMDLTTVVVLVDLNCHQTIIHVKVTTEYYVCIVHNYAHFLLCIHVIKI